jgi:transcriptional regulator with XRE-family HTH domain
MEAVTLPMAKSQHEPAYRSVPLFLRQLRERAGLTQRDLGGLLRRPQSWVYNCETGNRRVDVSEFALWCRACAVSPPDALRELLAEGAAPTAARPRSRKR